jgi:hypothetical protein
MAAVLTISLAAPLAMGLMLLIWTMRSRTQASGQKF